MALSAAVAAGTALADQLARLLESLRRVRDDLQELADTDAPSDPPV